MASASLGICDHIDRDIREQEDKPQNNNKINGLRSSVKIGIAVKVIAFPVCTDVSGYFESIVLNKNLGFGLEIDSKITIRIIVVRMITI
ncbi:hypothetical protein ACJJIX_13175 [Microbulbifer sp. VAAC004]|uniref:hypothetical protein n=1 Tax=unclassified Microbulbifer TaxID=2619833 RepID=UPI00403A3512